MKFYCNKNQEIFKQYDKVEPIEIYDGKYERNILKYEEDGKYKMEVVRKEDVKEYIKSYLEKITIEMGLETKFEINEDEDVFSVKMFSNNNPILIGKDGRTLTSLQTLIRQSLSNKIKFNVKINLDASNYKVKKERFFEKDIKNIINDVMRTKDEIKLDPMNSYERMIVHNHISKFENLVTESVGEEPERYIIIKYKEN